MSSAGNRGQTSINRKFISTRHALERMKERNIPYPDGNKLLPVYKNKHPEIFSKIRSNKRKGGCKCYVYWTDGTNIYVCQSKKVAVYIIITVL